MKLKKGDEVLIISGKDQGKRGKIERIFAKERKVLVPGLNIYKRHLKKKDEKNPGGIIEFSRAIPISKIILICPKCAHATRVGSTNQGRQKKRLCRKCQQIIA